MEVAPPPNPGASQQFMHKNRLQEYAQRSSLPLPVYQTVNEGFPHAPQFRSTVVVDGVTFKTSQTFTHRKEAEQNVAKKALEGISMKIKQEGCPLLRTDTMFCKSILHEYAVKMNLQKPTYTCSQSEGFLPMFNSSVLLDGNLYKGVAARNKKQAEQLAACTAIESILGNSDSSLRTLMSQIIKSKRKLYAAVHQLSVPNISQGMNPSSAGNVESLFDSSLLDGKESQVVLTNEMSPVAVHVMGCASEQFSQQAKQLKGECTFEFSSSLIGSGSGTALQLQPQAGLPSEQVTLCSQTVFDESHHRLCGQAKNEASSVGPSGFSGEIQGMPSKRKRKRSKKGKRECQSNST